MTLLQLRRIIKAAKFNDLIPGTTKIVYSKESLLKLVETLIETARHKQELAAAIRTEYTYEEANDLIQVVQEIYWVVQNRKLKELT